MCDRSVHVIIRYVFCSPPQIENGKLSDHEHSSTMEHLRLLLPAVLSVARVRSEAPALGEWQEDSGLGLYRAPEEGASVGGGATASTHSPDVEKKVRLNGFDAIFCARWRFVCLPSSSFLLSPQLTLVPFCLQVNALENIVCVLNREVERSSITVEAFSHQHRLDQEKIENLSNKVRQLERTLTVRDLQLAETEQLMRELQFCTFDGIFVWRIPDFSRRRQDAVGGRTPAMFSPGEMTDGLLTGH